MEDMPSADWVHAARCSNQMIEQRQMGGLRKSKQKPRPKPGFWFSERRGWPGQARPWRTPCHRPRWRAIQ